MVVECAALERATLNPTNPITVVTIQHAVQGVLLKAAQCSTMQHNEIEEQRNENKVEHNAAQGHTKVPNGPM